jgi:hypothetical protein
VCTHISVINTDYKCCTRKWKWTIDFYLQRKSPCKKKWLFLWWMCKTVFRTFMHTLIGKVVSGPVQFSFAPVCTEFLCACLRGHALKHVGSDSLLGIYLLTGYVKKNSSLSQSLRVADARETVEPSTSSSHLSSIMTFLQLGIEWRKRTQQITQQCRFFGIDS